LIRAAGIRPGTPDPVRHKARQIRLLLLDVDGVLTDGRLLYDFAGREFKQFHVHDGLGIHWLLRAGIEVGIVSGRTSRAVEIRARELGLTIVLQGIQDKWAVVQSLLEKKQLPASRAAFMGDDLVDLAVLRRVGLAIAVPNGHPQVRRMADWVTRTAGGAGAVREAAELLLAAQGHWQRLLREARGKG
jgi:3-deoxy-D-manno-octulosonate 8-phosphate phosphatase (KDO 8-P phosphatase)